ncbi:MAG: sulfite exporter TauE/SafE family protein [Verrucomicrobia bacterium]|nr:sulfite exporter TauE/SafE family protein [Verrucomicrobiota bacterium]
MQSFHAHTLIIWVLAAIGMHYSGKLDVEGLEPWFQFATGVIIVGMAAWMFARIRRARRAASHHHHHHHHSHEATQDGFEDAHEREHARQLQSRFAGQIVTTRQVVIFGLTGGLMPCPAAFAVLLLCLQIKQFALGFATVLAFSIGLAVTLVTVGAVAALSAREATRRFAGFAALAHKLPYASVGLIGSVGIVLAVLGLKHLSQ